MRTYIQKEALGILSEEQEALGMPNYEATIAALAALRRAQPVARPSEPAIADEPTGPSDALFANIT